MDFLAHLKWNVFGIVLSFIHYTCDGMIKELKNTPNTMVGFVATHDVTKEDFDEVVMPAVKELVGRTNKLNYLLVLETQLKDFTAGAWMQDALLGLTHITKWNRVAIVTSSRGVQYFTKLFSKIMPGEFKGFNQSELKAAISWVGGQDQSA